MLTTKDTKDRLKIPRGVVNSRSLDSHGMTSWGWEMARLKPRPFKMT